MAQPTTVIRKTKVDIAEVRAKELRELEDQLIMHKDTLHKLFRLLDQLDDHEVLNALNAGLSKSDPILTRVLKAVNETETDKALRNGLLLVQGLGKFNFSEIEPMILKFNKGLKLSTEYNQSKPLGWLGLLNVLTNKDFVEGSIVLTKFVKGFGTSFEQLKKEQGIVNPVQTDVGDLDSVKAVELPSKATDSYESKPKRNTSPKVKMLGLATGAALAAGSVLLKK
ncbi:DUF1641 domain-containing protein [Macrococcus hajekii]|uniref:DUF1641 domain-containing protein n=1 Tax=Macrococcus hajekii TaxID=198482 RepID=A0A4R6BP95_9STAP|nr:DUF1641 domain-containing protein [Macrococcus hajekii]TDM03487.1 DUF1641 domain-containing protein [Macrococcus hajekii]GGA99261.1 hypothetical protein GCM10007190_04130 [Macrococcus hajekii]